MSTAPAPSLGDQAKNALDRHAWREAFELKRSEKSRAMLAAIHSGEQEEIRLRACMMAAVDEGVPGLAVRRDRAGAASAVRSPPQVWPLSGGRARVFNGSGSLLHDIAVGGAFGGGVRVATVDTNDNRARMSAASRA